MSKRNGDVQVVDYIVGLTLIQFDGSLQISSFKRRGWEPEAILNWLALAGWGARHEETSPSTPSSTHTPRRLVQEAPDSTTVMSFSELVDQVRRLVTTCLELPIPLSNSSNSQPSRNAVQAWTLRN